MTEENKKTNLEMEIAQGEEVLREARILIEQGLYKGAVSRTYYFLFHHVKALLYLLGLEPKSHDGVSHLLNLHFIKDGKIESRFGKLFSRLQKYREQSDYDPAVTFTKEDVEKELAEALEFSGAIKEYLKKEGYL